MNRRSTRERRYVPKSCIESAELLIQTYAKYSSLDTTSVRQMMNQWNIKQKDDTVVVGPNVIAYFGGDTPRTLNISQNNNLLGDAAGLTDFNFNQRLEVGEGLIAIKTTPGDHNSSYNMHLGAVIESEPGKITLSNMMEVRGISVKPDVLQTITITEPDQFRREFGFSEEDFALGKLVAEREPV
jgi:hypothetical protein